MAAWGVSKTKSRFKAAVVGAGVSNWEGMVMESASPELEVRARALLALSSARLDISLCARSRSARAILGPPEVLVPSMAAPGTAFARPARCMICTA